MSEHRAFISWVRSGPDFLKGRFSRAHNWRFDGGAEVLASIRLGMVPDFTPPALLGVAAAGERAADAWSADWLTGDWAVRTPPSPEVPAAGPVQASAPPPAADEPASLLRPETAARLNDEDRELLARLQAELGAGTGSRAAHRAGAAPSGRASRPTPPATTRTPSRTTEVDMPEDPTTTTPATATASPAGE